MSQYTDSVEAELEGLRAVSTGICPGCETCKDDLGFECLSQLQEAWESGNTVDEPHFTWSGCDICGNTLGLDAEVWHAIDEHNAIMHFNHACVDCVVYIANGDEPEGWKPN